MGALTLRKLTDHTDEIDISTTLVSEQPDGVAKRSWVTVSAGHNQPGKSLWIGLRIDTRQSVRQLKVEQNEWIGPRTPEDPDALKQLNRVFPPKSGEKWTAYRIPERFIPGVPKFETRLKLSRHVAEYPDAQSVLILVTYIPDPGVGVKPADVLVGHSIIPAPRPKRSKKAKGKRKYKS